MHQQQPSIRSLRHPSSAVPSSFVSDPAMTGVVEGYYVPETQYYNIMPADAGTDRARLYSLGRIFSREECEKMPFLGKLVETVGARGESRPSAERLRRGSGCRRDTAVDADGMDRLLSGNMVDSGEYTTALIGWHGEGELKLYEWFRKRGEASVSILSAVRMEPYSLKLDLFSRNTGILESDIMLDKKALFIGCGSVGSLVAVELAKAGVGHFMLVDNDIFGYHNICRHQCGIYDVGRYKTDALAERILAINPYAEVIRRNRAIEEVDRDEVLSFCDRDTVIVGGADNREGDLYACDLGVRAGASFVSIGCWERAFAGEIFYCLPEGTPTYRDFLAATGYVSGRVTQNRRFYTTEADLEKASFEPGISADVNFVTIIGVKLILDLLNRGNDAYTQRVLPHLTQYTLVCNTNDPRVGGEQAEIFSYPLQVTTSIIVPYADECDIVSDHGI